MANPSQPSAQSSSAGARPYLWLGMLLAAYVGVYLCRKNLSVAVPLLERDWGLSKESLGMIGSVSTLSYAGGKFLFGPITDRIGGRTSLRLSMGLVALFGALGAIAPSLIILIIAYSLSRLAGSASWGAMLKLVPEWFSPTKMAFACGLLSLSFVFGGALATAFAGMIANLSHDSWRSVLGWPSAVLAVLLVLSLFVLPKSPEVSAETSKTSTGTRPSLNILPLFAERKFVILLALSFTLTLLRETFNFWTVDFVRTEAGAHVSSGAAALLSTPFDVCGAAGIVLMGWIFGRLKIPARQVLLVGLMLTLTLVLLVFPLVFQRGPWLLGAGVGCIGFLVYGPYSLLGGVMSVEVRGKEYAATVSGLVDGTGYIAGFLSGVAFGHLLSLGGYRLGFGFMASLTAISALLCMWMYPRSKSKGFITSVAPVRSS